MVQPSILSQLKMHSVLKQTPNICRTTSSASMNNKILFLTSLQIIWNKVLNIKAIPIFYKVRTYMTAPPPASASAWSRSEVTAEPYSPPAHSGTQVPTFHQSRRRILPWRERQQIPTKHWYPLFNKNQAAWNFLSPELEVTWRTVAIIIRVAFSFPTFVNSWPFSVFHSLQTITPRIY